MSYSAGTKLSHTDETERVTVLTDNHVMVTKGRYEGQRMPLGDWLILADGAEIQEDYIPFDQQREFELGTTWLCRNNAKQWRVAMQSEKDIVQLISVYTTEDDDRQYASHRLQRFPTRDEWINDWPANIIELTENPPHPPVGTTWTKESGGIARVAVQRRHYVAETKQVRGQMTTYYESYWANYEDWYYNADVAAPAPPELDTAILPPLPRSRVDSIDMGCTEEGVCRGPRLTEEQAWANVAHAAQPWFEAMGESVSQPSTATTIVDSQPAKPNPRYNNRNWPSPRPALLAKELWGCKLKHADALEQLAKVNRCTVDEFLTKPWTELDLPLTAKELMAKCERYRYYYGH
jgi:hypothetical protein